MPTDNISLEKRLRSLEEANKRHRRATLILSLVVLGFAIFALQSKTFSGRWLAIHDRQDHISAWWDDEGLELHDASGTVRAKLSLAPDGSPYLQFFDRLHRLRSQLFLYTDGAGYLMLWDKNGKGTRFPPSNTPLP